MFCFSVLGGVRELLVFRDGLRDVWVGLPERRVVGVDGGKVGGNLALLRLLAPERSNALKF